MLEVHVKLHQTTVGPKMSHFFYLDGEWENSLFVCLFSLVNALQCKPHFADGDKESRHSVPVTALLAQCKQYQDIPRELSGGNTPSPVSILQTQGRQMEGKM